MTKGWRNEPTRHSMAARGIKTSLPPKRKWRKGYNPSEKEIKAYDMGKQTAIDVFYFGHHQNLIDDIYDLEMEMEDRGASDAEIHEAIGRLKAREYIATVRRAGDFLWDTYEDQMKDKYGEDDEAHYIAFVRGYRQEMEDQYRGF